MPVTAELKNDLLELNHDVVSTSFLSAGCGCPLSELAISKGWVERPQHTSGWSVLCNFGDSVIRAIRDNYPDLGYPGVFTGDFDHRIFSKRLCVDRIAPEQWHSVVEEMQVI